MDSVGDLLGRYDQKEPQEIAALKRYIVDTFESPAVVALQGETIIITVPSAPLANTLRLRAQVLQKIANTSKRFIFRIG